MRLIRIIDTTLRDGMHAVSHKFTVQDMIKIAKALDEAGADTIEVSHGDGLGGSSYQYGFSEDSEANYLKGVSENIRNAKIAVLLIPGIGTQEDLKMAANYGAKIVRVATHVTEADIGEQHIKLAKQLGMEAIGFLMMSHMVSPEKVLEQAKLFESYGADIIYCADSAGAMLPKDVRERIEILKKNLNVPVGFHAHNNLGLAIGNSVAAIESGADCIDGTLRGIGASAGNAPHEVLIAVLKKMGISSNEDLYKLMDASENIIVPLMKQPLTIDKYALSIGYAGVYGSFFLHAKRAAEKFNVDARDVLMELGRLKTVGGQEDMIIEVAHKLSLKRRE